MASKTARRQWEPGFADRRWIYWPEHPLATRDGRVSFTKLATWQSRGYPPLDEFFAGDRRRGVRIRYEPGYWASNSALFWPEHPLAGKRGLVSLRRLEMWQNRGYPDWAAEHLRRQGGARGDTILGGPAGFTVSVRRRYVRYWWPEHPLALGNRVNEHALVYWQESGYDERVLQLLRSGAATIHHRNGIRDDNRPSNLELRLHHPSGNNRDDWIHLLRLEGYQVITPYSR